MNIVGTRHRWTSDDARRLYELYEGELREVIRKRAVNLGISMDGGDEQTAFELLKTNRELRMSADRYAELLASWQPIIDALTRRMADIHMMHTTPEIIVVKQDE